MLLLASDLEHSPSVMGGLWQRDHRAEAVKSLRDCALWAHGRGGVLLAVPTASHGRRTGKQEAEGAEQPVGRRERRPVPPATSASAPPAGVPSCMVVPEEARGSPRSKGGRRKWQLRGRKPVAGTAEPLKVALTVYPADGQKCGLSAALFIIRVQTAKVAWHDVAEGIQKLRKVGM